MNIKRLKLLTASLLLSFFQFVTIAKDNSSFYWYVAASLSKPAKEIADKFNNQDLGFKVMVISGGSGELISQILLSGKGDLFTPASDEFMRLVIGKKIVRSYRKLVKQELVFALARKYKGKSISFNELACGNYKIAIGNPKTMAAALAYQTIEKKMPDEITKKIRKQEISYPLDLNQSLSYLEVNLVDVALLFDTMARAAKLEYIKIPQEYNIESYAYIAMLSTEKSISNTNKFISFIYNNQEIFDKYEYKLIKDSIK